MICTECGRPTKPSKFGFKDQCEGCGRLTEKKLGVRRTIGIAAGEGIPKAGNISIIRNPTLDQEHMARKINRP